MEVRILGPVEVDGTSVTGREAAVLAALAVRAPHAVTAGQLVDDVWGEEPPVTAPKALQNAISRLRRLVGADAIETVGGGYRLVAEVDVREVERLAGAGDASAALARWRGDPVSVPAGERQRLASLRASLEDDAAAALLAGGDAGAAAAELERLVATEPYRERRWAMLVRALAADGRQGEALRAAQRGRRVLADDLGLDPGPELAEAERAVLDPPATAPAARRRLPRPSTSLVGRDELVAAVRTALEGSRLVTLVGPGGVGKTRVALAAVGDAADVVFVDLAAVSAERVWEATAAAAGVATQPGRSVADSVAAALDDGMVLLDSCEHVLDVAAEVADLLACSVLATSREPLGLPEERLVPVGALSRADAVRLFADRAGTSAPEVDALCERLDDLPLAIELAAARAPVMTPAQLIARLDDRFVLLDDRARRGQPRQRGLGAMVEWSYDLLEPDEQRVFERLSTFRSWFRLEDAEAVVHDGTVPRSAVAPALTRLVRASLVTVDAERRFRMLDTFRAYANRKLADPGLWRARHFDWVAEFAAEAGTGFVGPDQVAWFDRTAEMFDDVQAALGWCVAEGDPSAGLRVAGDLFHFWMGRARRVEGLRWVRELAGRADAMPALDRCRAIYGAGMIAMMNDLASVDELAAIAAKVADDRDSVAVAEALAGGVRLWRGDIDAAERLAERCMSVLDEPQHEGTLPRVWDLRAWVACARGDLAAARRYHRRTIDELAQLDDRHLYGAWVSIDGDIAYAQGRHDEARASGGKSLAIARSVRCTSCQSSALTTLALVEDEPIELLLRSYALVDEMGEQVGRHMTLPVLAAAYAGVDDEIAARLAGVHAAMRERDGLGYEMPGRAAFAAPRLAAARARLGDAAWHELLGQGRRLSWHAIVSPP